MRHRNRKVLHYSVAGSWGMLYHTMPCEYLPSSMVFKEEKFYVSLKLEKLTK